jgi:heme exporter protein B
MSALAATFRRDVALMWGGGGGALAPLGFFLGATMLVPLAMGPERNLLAAAGPPLVWIAAALAVLATLERLFQADLEDGSLDHMLLSPARRFGWQSACRWRWRARRPPSRCRRRRTWFRRLC